MTTLVLTNGVTRPHTDGQLIQRKVCTKSPQNPVKSHISNGTCADSQPSKTTNDVPKSPSSSTNGVNANSSTNDVNVNSSTNDVNVNSSTNDVNVNSSTTNDVNVNSSTTNHVNVNSSTTNHVNANSSTTNDVNVNSSTNDDVNMNSSTNDIKVNSSINDVNANSSTNDVNANSDNHKPVKSRTNSNSLPAPFSHKSQNGRKHALVSAKSVRIKGTNSWRSSDTIKRLHSRSLSEQHFRQIRLNHDGNTVIRSPVRLLRSTTQALEPKERKRLLDLQQEEEVRRSEVAKSETEKLQKIIRGVDVAAIAVQKTRLERLVVQLRTKKEHAREERAVFEARWAKCEDLDEQQKCEMEEEHKRQSEENEDMEREIKEAESKLDAINKRLKDHPSAKSNTFDLTREVVEETEPVSEIGKDERVSPNLSITSLDEERKNSIFSDTSSDDLKSDRVTRAQTHRARILREERLRRTNTVKRMQNQSHLTSKKASDIRAEQDKKFLKFLDISKNGAKFSKFPRGVLHKKKTHDYTFRIHSQGADAMFKWRDDKPGVRLDNVNFSATVDPIKGEKHPSRPKKYYPRYMRVRYGQNKFLEILTEDEEERDLWIFGLNRLSFLTCRKLVSATSTAQMRSTTPIAGQIFG